MAKPSSKKKEIKKEKKEAPRKKIEITNRLRRTWWRLRKAWNLTMKAFSGTMSRLTDAEAEELYEVVRHSLFKDSYVEILRARPELKELVKSDDDRLFMHDVYEVLSWRLKKKEPYPKDVDMIIRMKGRIGRDAIAPNYL